MRKNFILALCLSALLVSYFPSHASSPDGKPKYAHVNVYFGGLRPAKVFTIVDGKVELTKCESGFMDLEEGELAVFSKVQIELEKLGANGYKLQTTTALSPSLVSYTLVKE